MIIRLALSAALAVGLAGGSAWALPLDLSSFTQYGSGNWNVAADNLSVTQTQNVNQGAFVSGDSFINSSFEGSFEVQTNSDDDYIGFVFGFGADDSSPFFLFDWKQLDQSGSYDGFTLARVTGGLSAIPFNSHQDSATGYEVLATDVDTSTADPKGWDYNTPYDFKLTYQTNRILIEVGGGDPLGAGLQTIFDLSAADAGLASFEAGRFGFYNYSQANVRYEGFTEQAASVVPLPASLPLLFGGLCALGLISRRRRA